VSTALADGTRIEYEVQGAGEPVLLVHGLGYARWGWEPIADRLSTDFLVVSFDNRGIGESDVPPGPYTVAQLAADAVAVLDAAGLERVGLVGASLGGMVAQQVAIAYPERVEKLVLLCTTPGGADAYPMPERTVRLFAEAASLPPEEALRRFVENSLLVRGELVDVLYERRLANPPHPQGWQAQAAAGMGWDAAGRLGRISAPTLILHGTADNVIDYRNSELLAEAIPGARLRLFDGAGHLFFWEQPDEIADEIREFLR
jgi:pimeloyl-ACP methyl ester carboxylesterase